MLIQTFSKGVNRYLDPVNIEDDEFVSLENVTVSRGSISKKPGSTLLGQLRLTASLSGATTDVSGNFSGIPGYVLGTVAVTFSFIVPGTIAFTISGTNYSDDSLGNIINDTTTLAVGQISYVTGSIVITGQAISSPITGTLDCYPGNPVLGISTLQESVLSFTSLFLDNKFAYGFNSATRNFFSLSTYASSGNTVSWNGTTSNQFSFANFQNVLFLTNGVSGMQYKAIAALVSATLPTVAVTVNNHGLVLNDLIFFYQCQGSTSINGLQGTVSSVIDTNNFQAIVPALSSLSAYSGGGIIQYLTSQYASPNIDGMKYFSSAGFTNFAPPLDNTSTPAYLVGCKSFIVFGNRLLALGTYEQQAFGTVTFYPNRIRWCQILSAIYTNATIQASSTSTPADNWWSPPLGSGGFLTLGGNQGITNAQIIHETLVIGLELSFRKIVTTNITILPFIDQSVSVEYGSICPFGNTVIKNSIFGVSNNGIVITTSNDASRIDEETIPDTVSTIRRSSNGLQQVCCIRDYRAQLIYLTFPTQSSSFPNRTLVFNYIEKNWSFWTEIATSYGYYIEQGSSRTWANAGTWALAGTWGQQTGTTGQSQVAMGTPSGSVLLKGGTAAFNEPNLIITAISGSIITIPNNAFSSGMIANGLYLYITNCIGNTSFNNTVVQVLSVSGSLITVSGTSSGTYISGGLAAIADNIQIISKAYSPNAQQGKTQTLKDLFLLMQTTLSGECSVGIFSNFLPPSNQSIEQNLIGNFISPYNLRTYPDTNLGLTGQQQDQSFNWHRVQSVIQGSSIQLSIYMTTEQMTSTSVPYQQIFILQGLYIVFSETGAQLC